MTTEIPNNKVAVSFTAEILPQTSEALIQTLLNLNSQNVKEIDLLFSTPGGSVSHGINIYNIMKSIETKINIYNIGIIDSIGNVIFQGANLRYATPNSTFLFHGVAANFDKSNLNQNQLKEILDKLKADEVRIAEILSSSTDLTAEDISTWFASSETLTAQQALNKGIADELKTPQIPNGIQSISFAFNR